MSRKTHIDDNAALLKFDLMAMSHAQFDYVDSQLCPTVKYSTSIKITADANKSCIQRFLQGNLFPNNKKSHQIIEIVAN